MPPAPAHARAALAATAAVAVAAAAAAALGPGCAKAQQDAPATKARPEPEAPGPAPAASRFVGLLAGHRFTITVEGGRATHGGPDGWRWQQGAGEVAVDELGPADADTHFLVERSPRTVVRGDGDYAMLTEVVMVAGGRVFRCSREERVTDPDGPAAKDAVDLGVAVCTSLRVEP